MNSNTRKLVAFFLAIVTMVALSHWSYAFDRTTDSIRNALQLVKTDTARLRIMNQFAESQIDKKTDYAIELAAEALLLAKRKGYLPEEGKSLNILSWAYYRKGDYTKAFDYGITGLKQNLAINDLPQLAVAYRNVASVYNSQANYKLAIEYFQKDLALHKKIMNPVGIGRALNNLAFTFFKAEQRDSAKMYIQRALAHNSYLGDYYMLAFTYRNYGEIYETENRADSALYFYNNAIDKAKKINNLFLIQTTLYRKGRLLTTEKKYEEAVLILKEAEQFAKELGSKSGLSQVYKQMAVALERIGDYKGAYISQAAYSNLNDTLFEERSRSKLNQLQASFEAEKKQAEIELLNKEKRLQKVRLHNQLVLVFFLIILKVLVTIILVIIWRRNRFKKKVNAELTEQKRILEESSVLKDKIFSIISHDLRSPIASLSAVLPLLDRNSLNEEVFDTIKKNLGKQLSSLNFTLDNLLLWARAQWKGSTPPEKTLFLMGAIIENNIELLRPLADNKKIRLHATIPSETFVWADKQQTDIIIRNILLNAIKFTHEKGLINIQVIETANQIRFMVSDDGVGMSATQIASLFQLKTHFTTPGTQKEKGTGLGLLICKEFALLNDGDIEIQSEPGEGTIVSLTLPNKEF